VARLPPRKVSARLGGTAIGGIALILFALLALGALAVSWYYSPRLPVPDAATLCPVSGPDGITVVLVDTSDDLPEPARREARTILDDLIAVLPPYHLLDIRVLDIEGMKSRSLFSKCNPGDGAGLSEWISNPRIARLKWLESFRKPAADAIDNSLGRQKAKSSPIMAAIQDISIERFAKVAAARAEKRLIVISDMIESTREYSQYPAAGDLSYERFRRSPAYQKFRTDLHGALVTIDYVQRIQPKIDNTKHAEFWHEWTRDNLGKWDMLHRLQGAN
jgi:hypothetical protein